MEQSGGGSASPFCRASSLCGETETPVLNKGTGREGTQEVGGGAVCRANEAQAALQTLTLLGAREVIC